MTDTRKKSRKPFKDYPLLPHAYGQWARKNKGRLHFFGVWADTDAARREYLAERDFLQAGLDPLPDGQSIVLVCDLCNAFLTEKKQATGKRRAGPWDLY